MEKIGIGMIGCGGMGRNVTGAVLKQDERLELRSLVDPDERSIEAARKELNPEASVYDSPEAMYAADGIDWVMVASWNCFHKEHVLSALAAGKHIFCQKPLTTTLADALEVYRAGLAGGGLFSMGFNLRRSPHYRRLKEILSDGAIGEIVSMEFNETLEFNHGGYIMGDWRRLRENSGTHVLEKCCHDIDLVNWMTESRASRVASFGGLNFFTPENISHQERVGSSANGVTAFQGWGGAHNLNPFTSDKDIIDNQVAILEFENGIRASFHTNCCAGITERRMYIVGTEGAIRADLITEKIEVRRVGWEARWEVEDTRGAGTHGGGDEVLAQELADCMIHGTEPEVGVAEGVEAATTCFVIDEAMDSGRVVDASPYWKKVDEVRAAGGG
jgi:predicted dehydrogenase